MRITYWFGQLDAVLPTELRERENKGCKTNNKAVHDDSDNKTVRALEQTTANG